MPTFDQAIQNLNTSANRLGHAGKEYGDKRKRQERAHERTVEAHEAWLASDGKNAATNERLRKAYDDENAAKREADDAENALRAAAVAFSTAFAEFMAAVVMIPTH